MTAKVSNPVQRDKAILGGAPTFPGTRVPIKNLMDYLIGGESIDDFLADFPSVKPAQVQALLKLIDKKLPALVA